MILFPPFLPQSVEAGAFCSGIGELEVIPDDALLFLDAFRNDGIELLGWELWVVDQNGI